MALSWWGPEGFNVTVTSLDPRPGGHLVYLMTAVAPEQAATVYAANFTLDEMRQMEAFFRQPAGQKLIEKWPAVTQQTAQIGQDVSRKAAEELRLRLTDALRQKGHSDMSVRDSSVRFRGANSTGQRNTF